jgi:hypothetical protein
MSARHHGFMRDQTEIQAKEETEAVDPYGDVALGVECAWPQSIPVVQATLADSAS